MIYFGIQITKINLSKKNKMACKIKMAAKHEFSIASVNSYGNQLKRGKNIVEVTFFLNFKMVD
jgi:hypothetical protein